MKFQFLMCLAFVLLFGVCRAYPQGTCSVTTISLPSTTNGTLTNSDCAAPHRSYSKADVYRFNGSAGQRVTVSMTSTVFDTYLVLVRPNGSVLEEDDDDGVSSNSYINIQLPVTGTYTVEATAYRSDGRGAYTLALTGGPVTLPPTVTTESATLDGPTTVTLQGRVNPNGSSTTAWFLWGTTNPPATQSSVRTIGSGTSSVSYQQQLPNLTPNRMYYFQAAAQGGGSAIVYGNVATFETRGIITNYTLTIDVLTVDGGSGRVISNPAGINCPGTCSASFTSGTTVSLSASAQSGSNFSGWTGACGGTGTCSISMTSTRSVSATFTRTQPNTYTLSVSVSGSGRVTSSPGGIDCASSCSASFTDGTSVSLTATASSGYSFAGWGGSCSGTGGCTISMTGNRSISANFASAPRTYTLSVSVSGNGRVTSTPSGVDCSTSNCSAAFADGTSVSLTASAGSGSTFTSWGGACSGTGSCSVRMNSNESVSATFSTQSNTAQLIFDSDFHLLNFPQLNATDNQAVLGALRFTVDVSDGLIRVNVQAKTQPSILRGAKSMQIALPETIDIDYSRIAVTRDGIDARPNFADFLLNFSSNILELLAGADLSRILTLATSFNDFSTLWGELEEAGILRDSLFEPSKRNSHDVVTQLISRLQSLPADNLTFLVPVSGNRQEVFRKLQEGGAAFFISNLSVQVPGRTLSPFATVDALAKNLPR